MDQNIKDNISMAKKKVLDHLHGMTTLNILVNLGIIKLKEKDYINGLMVKSKISIEFIRYINNLYLLI